MFTKLDGRTPPSSATYAGKTIWSHVLPPIRIVSSLFGFRHVCGNPHAPHINPSFSPWFGATHQNRHVNVIVPFASTSLKPVIAPQEVLALFHTTLPMKSLPASKYSDTCFQILANVFSVQAGTFLFSCRRCLYALA